MFCIALLLSQMMHGTTRDLVPVISMDEGYEVEVEDDRCDLQNGWRNYGRANLLIGTVSDSQLFAPTTHITVHNRLNIQYQCLYRRLT